MDFLRAVWAVWPAVIANAVIDYATDMVQPAVGRATGTPGVYLLNGANWSAKSIASSNNPLSGVLGGLHMTGAPAKA
jgi:hypothetical protein